MVLEKRLKKRMGKKNFNIIVYLIGGIIELFGLWLIFAFDNAMTFIHKIPFIFALILGIGGFLLAVSVRK